MKFYLNPNFNLHFSKVTDSCNIQRWLIVHWELKACVHLVHWSTLLYTVVHTVQCTLDEGRTCGSRLIPRFPDRYASPLSSLTQRPLVPCLLSFNISPHSIILVRPLLCCCHLIHATHPPPPCTAHIHPSPTAHTPTSSTAHNHLTHLTHVALVDHLILSFVDNSRDGSKYCPRPTLPTAEVTSVHRRCGRVGAHVHHWAVWSLS